MAYIACGSNPQNTQYVAPVYYSMIGPQPVVAFGTQPALPYVQYNPAIPQYTQSTGLQENLGSESTFLHPDFDDPNLDVNAIEDAIQGTVTHSSSYTWTSSEEQEWQRWLKLRPALSRFAPDSNLVPIDYQDWIRHRRDSNEHEQQKLWVAMARLMGRKGISINIAKAFNGRRLIGSYSAVLSMATIWHPWHEPVPGISAVWPSLQEMRWEGDDRRKTDVGRFLPLPREPGNDTVAWHHLKCVEISKLDEVRRLEDMGLRQKEEEDLKLDHDGEVAAIGAELWGAMNFCA